jgi:thiol-disulfide isomerase/thioredoxin
MNPVALMPSNDAQLPMKNRGTLLLLTIGLVVAAALALGSSIYLVRRARSAVEANAQNAKVIRFAKDPETAPPFLLRDLNGKIVSIADGKGKVVILNFWATWCPPCREEIPEFVKLQQAYKDKLLIIGASEDDDGPQKVQQFAERFAMNYPIVMATKELIDNYGGVPALPTSFLIDPQGRVVQKHTGLYEYEVYEREVRALAGLPVDARIETFADTGQIFLKNAANATELPDVDLSGLTADQKKEALHRLNAETCTCGCTLTLAECRINDSSCPVSKPAANEVVKRVRAGQPEPPPPSAQSPQSGAQPQSANPKT